MKYTLPERNAIITRIERALSKLDSLNRTAIITMDTDKLAVMADSLEEAVDDLGGA